MKTMSHFNQTANSSSVDSHGSIMYAPSTLYTIVSTTVTVISSLLVIFGILGNAAVISIITRVLLAGRAAKSGTVYVYVLFLSIVDAAYLMFVPFSISFEVYGTWLWGLGLCRVYIATEVLNKTLSVYILVLLSADRYRAICHPLSSTRRNIQKAGVILLITTVLVCLGNSPMYWYTIVMTHPYGLEMCIPQFPVYSNTSMSIWYRGQTYYLIYLEVVYFAAPTVTILTFYCLLLRRLAMSEKAQGQMANGKSGPQEVLSGDKGSNSGRATAKPSLSPSSEPAFRNKKQLMRRGKVTKSILVVILFYFGCWGPYWLFQAAAQFVLPYNHFVAYLAKIIFVLPLVNSALNPVLYGILNRRLRASYAEALRKRKQRRRNQNDLPPAPTTRQMAMKRLREGSILTTLGRYGSLLDLAKTFRLTSRPSQVSMIQSNRLDKQKYSENIFQSDNGRRKTFTQVLNNPGLGSMPGAADVSSDSGRNIVRSSADSSSSPKTHVFVNKRQQQTHDVNSDSDSDKECYNHRRQSFLSVQHARRFSTASSGSGDIEMGNANFPYRYTRPLTHRESCEYGCSTARSSYEFAMIDTGFGTLFKKEPILMAKGDIKGDSRNAETGQGLFSKLRRKLLGLSTSVPRQSSLSSQQHKLSPSIPGSGQGSARGNTNGVEISVVVYPESPDSSINSSNSSNNFVTIAPETGSTALNVRRKSFLLEPHKVSSALAEPRRKHSSTPFLDSKRSKPQLHAQYQSKPKTCDRNKYDLTGGRGAKTSRSPSMFSLTTLSSSSICSTPPGINFRYGLNLDEMEYGDSQKCSFPRAKTSICLANPQDQFRSGLKVIVPQIIEPEPSTDDLSETVLVSSAPQIGSPQERCRYEAEVHWSNEDERNNFACKRYGMRTCSKSSC